MGVGLFSGRVADILCTRRCGSAHHSNAGGCQIKFSAGRRTARGFELMSEPSISKSDAYLNIERWERLHAVSCNHMENFTAGRLPPTSVGNGGWSEAG